MNVAKDLSWKILWNWINPSRAQNPLESILPREKQLTKSVYFFVLGLSFVKQPWPFLKLGQSRGGSVLLQLPSKSTSLRCLYRSRHHIRADTAAGKVHFLQTLLFYCWTSSGKSSERWQRCLHLIPLPVTLYPSMISSTGEKWQVLCQGKSSESERSLPKRFLVNYKGFFPLHWHATSPLLPPPRLSLSMSATPGHALLHGEEARHVWNVYSCCCQDTEGGSSGPCAKLLATESVPSQGLQMCRLTGPVLMRGLKARSSIFWAILSHSFRLNWKTN